MKNLLRLTDDGRYTSLHNLIRVNEYVRIYQIMELYTVKVPYKHYKTGRTRHVKVNL